MLMEGRAPSQQSEEHSLKVWTCKYARDAYGEMCGVEGNQHFRRIRIEIKYSLSNGKIPFRKSSFWSCKVKEFQSLLRLLLRARTNFSNLFKSNKFTSILRVGIPEAVPGIQRHQVHIGWLRALECRLTQPGNVRTQIYRRLLWFRP